MEGRDYWRQARASRAAWLVDGAAYFAALHDAMSQAREQILMLGWDIDSRTRLLRDEDPKESGPELGHYLGELLRASPQLHIYVLIWDYAAVYAREREWFSGWRLAQEAGDRLHFRLDNQFAVGASHHQKIVVIDDRLAFSGGLDVTRARWDTPEHRPDDPRRQTADGEYFGPFHDVQAAVSGEAAAALGALARQRWLHGTGEELGAPSQQDGEVWPAELPVRFRDIRVCIARTRAADLELSAVREVESSCLATIRNAQDYLYIENQYFTSSCITDALVESLQQTSGPEILLVQPRSASGWLEEGTMSAVRRVRLGQLKAADKCKRLRICYPDRKDLGDEHIKVHGKVMVADDSSLRIGSANLSNRSMGLDTECDLIFLPCDDEQRKTVRDFVLTLLAEHTGSEVGEVDERWRRESLLAASEQCGSANRRLVPLPVKDSGPELQLLPKEIFDADNPVDMELLGSEEAAVAEPRPDSRRRAWPRFVILLVLLTLAALMWRFTPLSEWLAPDRLATLPELVRNLGHPLLVSALVFTLGSLVVVPITLLIVATGFFYGPAWGIACSMLGILLSAMVTYAAGAVLGRDAVRSLAGTRLARISRALGQQGIMTLAVLRLLPIAPYSIVNVVAGASHIRFRDFMLGTLVGMTPGVTAIVLLTTGAGSMLGANLREGLPLIGAAAGIFIGLVVATRIWRARRNRPAA